MAGNLVEPTVAQVSSPNPHSSLAYSMYDKTINRWGGGRARVEWTGSTGVSKRCGEEYGFR